MALPLSPIFEKIDQILLVRRLQTFSLVGAISVITVIMDFLPVNLLFPFPIFAALSFPTPRYPLDSYQRILRIPLAECYN
jgi:hypothetical protein